MEEQSTIEAQANAVDTAAGAAVQNAHATPTVGGRRLRSGGGTMAALQANGGSALSEEQIVAVDAAEKIAPETPAALPTATVEADVTTPVHTVPVPPAEPQTPDITAGIAPALPSPGAPTASERLNLQSVPTMANGAPLMTDQMGGASTHEIDTNSQVRPVAPLPSGITGDPTPAQVQPPPEQTREAVDALHAALMNTLSAPRRSGVGLIQDENALLERRRAEIMEAARAKPGASGLPQRSGLLGALGSLGARRAPDPSRQIADIDRTMLANRQRERLLYGSKYESMLGSADEFYRDYDGLANKISTFNARFEASPKGQAFLRHLQYVSDHTGQPVEEIRARLHQLKDKAPELAELRRRADKLYADPEFGPVQKEIEAQAAKLSQSKHAFQENLHSLADNKVPLGEAGDLKKVLGKLDLPNSLLAKPGGVRSDGIAADFKQMMEKFGEEIKKMIERIAAAFGFGRSSPAP